MIVKQTKDNLEINPVCETSQVLTAFTAYINPQPSKRTFEVMARLRRASSVFTGNHLSTFLSEKDGLEKISKTVPFYNQENLTKRDAFG
uniref:Uncharacterized protein n=1 Tax=Romanomermis culicivorax TaxID=13658 RepID=A0A915IVL3_ROMCU